jgi:hypothetical protein
MMADQLQGPFEKFVGSPYSKKRPLPHLHNVPTRSNKVSPHIIIAPWTCIRLQFGKTKGGIWFSGSLLQSRDSSVGIALGYELDDRGSTIRFRAEAGNFSLHHCVQNGFGAHPASYPMGTRGSFPGVKRPGCEADQSPPSSTEVKEFVKLYLHSPIHLHGVVLS